MITAINIEWMIRKKKAQIRKRKRETCNRIEFTFSVVSTYPKQYNTILPAITTYAYVSSRATEHCGWVLTTPATQAHVEFPGFKPCPRDRLLWKSFSSLPQSLRPHSRQYLKLGHGIFLSMYCSLIINPLYAVKPKQLKAKLNELSIHK
jgi:hypothetical protein